MISKKAIRLLVGISFVLLTSTTVAAQVMDVVDSSVPRRTQTSM